MKELFEYIKNDILHGMLSGLLVTKNDINFDIGGWQHRMYGKYDDIYKSLIENWTSHTINLLIIDNSTSIDAIKNFISECSYEKRLRKIFLVYCIVIKSDRITNDFMDFLKSQKYPMNNYSNKLVWGEYTIFVCDFIKNLLMY